MENSKDDGLMGQQDWDAWYHGLLQVLRKDILSRLLLEVENHKMPITFPVYILAFNNARAKDWFRDTFPKHPTKDMKYVSSFDGLQGIGFGASVVKLDSFYLRKDMDDISSQVKYLQVVGRLKVYYESDFQEE